MAEINYLKAELLSDRSKIREIDHWLSVMNWVTGWHYDLDIIWLLQKIESMGLPKGATIVDAGAGLGITQFILAARGYNILSLDFAARNVPEASKGIFDISQVNEKLENYHHTYMDFMVYKDHKKTSFIKRLFSLLMDPRQLGYRFLNYYRKFKSKVDRSKELKNDHTQFGKIKFIRGTFNQIPLADDSVDLLVSISAFEHNKFEDMKASVKEFERVLKPGASMLVTTSGGESKDVFHQPSQGWCISADSLKDMFEAMKINGSFVESKNSLTSSSDFISRIPTAYKMSGTNGLPYGKISDLQYVPVGIVRSKPS